MTEKTLTTENIRPALDALRGELAPWPVVAMKQDKLNDTQKSAVNSGITSGLVAQIIANTAAIRALESAITGTGLRPLVVASLPAIGTQGILYIVPVTTYDPATDADVVNYSNEYIWIVAPDAPVTEGYYEQVGQTGIVINNGQLNITVNGTSVGTFTANQSGDTTAAITVPTNADYVDRTTDQTVAGDKTWTGEQSFTLPIVGSITGTASKAIADEDGTNIKSGYVNVAGNQTVSGQKTWSGNQYFASAAYHKNTTYEIGNIPASNIVTNIYLADKNNVYTSFVRSVIYASGKTATEIRAKNAFKNGILDPTGSDINSNLNVEVQPNGDKTLYFDGAIRNNVLPYATSTYSLGSSSYQWSSVYAQTYYYNGTAWGLDKANTWTQNQSVINAVTPKFILQDNRNDRTYSASTSLSGGVMRWECDDKDGAPLSRISTTFRSDKAVQLQFSIFNEDSTGTEFDRTLRLVAARDTTVPASFYPEQTDTVNLGTSSNRWSAVYAQSYYYNGTAWGLDKENVWSGNNRFVKNAGLSDISTYSDNTMAFTANANTIFFNTRGSSNYPSFGTFLFAGYASGSAPDRYGQLKLVRSTDIKGGTYDGYKPDTSFNLWRVAPHYSLMDFVDAVRVQNDGTNNYIAPITTNATDLGTSTNKWKTLNGINPGALSLPDYNSSAKVDISGSITPDAYGNIRYTPTINGWLYVCFNVSNATTTGVVFSAQVKDSNVANANFVQTYTVPTSFSYLAVFFPVNANKEFIIEINFTGYSITKAHIIPCLGNV